VAVGNYTLKSVTWQTLKKRGDGKISVQYLLIGFNLVIIALVLTTCCNKTEVTKTPTQWHGVTLDGNLIHFSKLSGNGLILNIFSHSCAPCLKELPALDILAEEAARYGVSTYLVADGNPIAHGISPPPDGQPDLSKQILKKKLIETRTKFNIKIPIVIMEPSIDLVSKSGFVTALPVTFLFKTGTMQLSELHSGPLSTLTARDEILNEISRLPIHARLTKLSLR